ncbi:MAG: hypothetical protein AAFY83_03765, partial [Pseudomonadota bacterium]
AIFSDVAPMARCCAKTPEVAILMMEVRLIVGTFGPLDGHERASEHCHPYTPSDEEKSAGWVDFDQRFLRVLGRAAARRRANAPFLRAALADQMGLPCSWAYEEQM